MATYWVPDLHDIKRFSDHLKHSLLFNFCQWCIICVIEQALKYIRLSLWSCLIMSSKLRTTKILKSGWRDLKRVGCHGNRNCSGCGCVAFRTISLPSFNGFCSKLTKIKHYLYIWCNIWLSVWRHQSSCLHILVIFQTLRTVPTKYQGFCAKLGPRGKSRSLKGLLESTKKNWGSHAFFRDN